MNHARQWFMNFCDQPYDYFLRMLYTEYSIMSRKDFLEFLVEVKRE